jgi:hypothetical protein
MKLISNYIILLLGMTTWGVGSTPLNVHAKVEQNEDLIVVIWAGYTKALKIV